MTGREVVEIWERGGFLVRARKESKIVRGGAMITIDMAVGVAVGVDVIIAQRRLVVWRIVRR